MGALQAITAAATRIISGKKKGSGGNTNQNSGLATLAWDMFDTVPEVGTFADWVSNAMSGATLFAARRGPDGEILDGLDTDRASMLVSTIAGGPDGQSVMLSSFGTQLAVTGDSWLVIIPGTDASGTVSVDRSKDRWVVLSTEEAKAQSGKLKATIDGEQIEIPEYDPDVEQDPATPVFMRVWKPSPRRHAWATSPVIRSLTVLEELRLLNAAVAAIARSRITGRGILFVPAGARFPAQPGQDQAEDSLLDTFIEVASTAIREPESAAATVPIILELPSDLIDGVKWVQFTSEFDAMAIQLRDEAIRRFATGADVPAEVLMGLGDASHWGAWAITAEALRMGAEPRLALVCQALTTQWLRPLLEDEGHKDAGEWMVWYDTSGLRSSSNKGSSALEAYKLGLINGPAARRELGFTEADAPGSPSDIESMPAVKAAEGGKLPVNETQSTPNPGQPTEAPLAASSAVLDSFTAGTDQALAEAVDGLVWNALGVAGRKLILTPVVPRPQRGVVRELSSVTVYMTFPVQDAYQIDAFKLLEGAWDRVPVVAARYGLDAVSLAAALDSYTRALLATGEHHEFDHIPRLLAQLRLSGMAAA